LIQQLQVREPIDVDFGLEDDHHAIAAELHSFDFIFEHQLSDAAILMIVPDHDLRGDRERERHRERQRDRERETERKSDRDRQTERCRHGEGRRREGRGKDLGGRISWIPSSTNKS
jgi:hypothetical protein